MSAEADKPGKTTLVECESLATGDPSVPGKSTLVQGAYGGAPDPGAMRRAFLASIEALANGSPDLPTVAVELESEPDGETAPDTSIDGAVKSRSPA